MKDDSSIFDSDDWTDRSQPHLPNDDVDGEEPDTQSRSLLPKAQELEGWKPASLRRPFLLGAMALSLLLLVVVEVLAQVSRIKGALVFYASIDDIPPVATFAYSYLPTIVATLFSLMWNWIDLDVKRIQPWIEVSKPGGAEAKNSLLLDYTSDFLPVAPFRAAKRRQADSHRHWPVVASGTALVLILCVLTPVQTSLLGVALVPRNDTTAVVTERSQLAPTKDQSANYRAFNLAYAMSEDSNINVPLPPFTSESYALLPFYISDDMGASRAERRWTAQTTKLWADVACSPANFTQGVHTVKGTKHKKSYHFPYTFYLDGGCSSSVSFNFTALLDEDYYSAFPDYVLSYRHTHESAPGKRVWDCPTSSNNSNSLLVYLATFNTDKNESDVTALQCDLSYYSQTVEVTLKSRSRRPSSDEMKSMGARRTLGPEQFNSSSFLLSFPGDHLLEWKSDNDWVDTQYVPIDQTSDDTRDLDCDTFCLLLQKPLAAAGQQSPGEATSGQISQAVKALQQQLFSLTISDRLTNQTTLEPSEDPALSSATLTSIVVSRLFALVSELLLFLTFLVLAFIYHAMSSTTCVLRKSPSSIADLIDIAHNSPEAVRLLGTMDTANENFMAYALEGFIFRLEFDEELQGNKLLVEQPAYCVRSYEEQLRLRPSPYSNPVKPWIMRRVTGSLMGLVLVAGMAMLTCLKVLEWRRNGLERPSEDFEVRQLMENYIPTAFATGMEPFWILLTRTMCVFQPFNDLWKGHSPSAKSIETTHTSVPPQLTLSSAMASKHDVLSLLCLATLLANVLAIGLSALFNEKTTLVEESLRFDPWLRRNKTFELYNFDPSALVAQSSPFLVLINMTYNSPLSPWMSDEFMFPKYADFGQEGGEYTLKTEGFGIDINCTGTLPATYHLSEAKSGRRAENTCDDSIAYLLEDAMKLGHDTNMTGPASFTKVVTSSASDVSKGLCPPMIAFLWAKAADGLGEKASITASSALCYPVFRTAEFEIAITDDGSVRRYKRVGDFKPQLGDERLYVGNGSDVLLAAFSEQLQSERAAWGNTNATRDWMSHFLFLEMGSDRGVIDPDTPVPDPDDLIPSLGRIYSRLFGTFLNIYAYNDGYPVGTYSDGGWSVEGKEVTRDTRVFMDSIAFSITMVVLVLDLVFAVIFYLPESLYILPRPPSSVLSILAYIAPSRAVQYGRPLLGWGEQTFSFGRYQGHDGQSHIGVEIDPFVARTKDTSLGSYIPLW